MGLILWTIIGGVIIGLLGKLVAPGDRDNIPFWLTVVCGIVGILIGNFIYRGSGTTTPRASTGGATSGRSPSQRCW